MGPGDGGGMLLGREWLALELLVLELLGVELLGLRLLGRDVLALELSAGDELAVGGIEGCCSMLGFAL